MSKALAEREALQEDIARWRAFYGDAANDPNSEYYLDMAPIHIGDAGL